jgi:hypothetical protein
VIGPADPIVLDSSVLVAYERMKMPGASVLHEAQSRPTYSIISFGE